ncbi:MAG: hypothetical protein IJ242_04445 [Clostridia bacterium]|nr:hypothetical protein [Clostridia bacterium]
MNKGIMVLVLYCAFVMAMVPGDACAYIDPSATTFLLQAIIGAGVAIAAGVSIYWRKAKKKVNKMIGKDENSGKNAESDDIL